MKGNDSIISNENYDKCKILMVDQEVGLFKRYTDINDLVKSARIYMMSLHNLHIQLPRHITNQYYPKDKA